MSPSDEPTTPLPDPTAPTAPIPTQPAQPAPTRPWSAVEAAGPWPEGTDHHHPPTNPFPPVQPTYIAGPRPGEPAHYPPPPYVPYTPPRPLPGKPGPSTAKVLGLTLGGISAAVVLLCAGLAVIGGISERNARDAMSVEVTKCEASAGIASVEFTVTNNGNQKRSATVDIEYRRADGTRLDTDTSFVSSIAPGDSAAGHESTILDGDPEGTITCAVRIG